MLSGVQSSVRTTYENTRTIYENSRVIYPQYVPLNIESLEKIIINCLKSNVNAVSEFEIEIANNFYLNNNTYNLTPNIKSNGIMNQLFNCSLFKEQRLSDIKGELEKLFGVVYNFNFSSCLRYFIIMTGIKYIYETFLDREPNYDAVSQIRSFINENDSKYITGANGARRIARAIGADRMKEFFDKVIMLDQNEALVSISLESYLARVRKN